MPFILAEELSAIDLDAIRHLQSICYENSKSKRFHEAGDHIRAASVESDTTETRRNLSDYYGNCLMLIVGEVSEAHEQIRHGRAFDETYYNEGSSKPEGVPSELADTVIRVFDVAAETGIDLAGMIAEKLIFNATREPMHGKKF